jgi:hypothetical protein
MLALTALQPLFSSVLVCASFVRIAQLKSLALLRTWSIALLVYCYGSLGWNDWAEVLNG